MDRRARLRGLDEPTRHRLEHRITADSLGIDPEEIERMQRAWLDCTAPEAEDCIEAQAAEGGPPCLPPAR